ncbi:MULTISPECIES: ATP-binding protein [unclassified Streptomyces]|uniref:ATP-binding protein n=1 Tax=unclassified Streptomyces TaxID=2593676 RepID=UPI002258B579|nr:MULTISPECIES: ATP-binding protein [unclassified Streptomyces]MCX5061931.1 ATP-binding protein [Streptomyces sp. NBC_00452]MCX5292460.1 ATP-binding protein [Streptomyces sp. NBC_00183]
MAEREAELRTAGLTVCTVPGPAALLVRADADRLHQALGNLLSNAARHYRPGDTVTVTTTLVEVADTGPGIPAEELPHVFDRLWRGARARAGGGSGIGLAVVKELVTAHGGTVTADSGPSGGTRLTLRLPRAAPMDHGSFPAPASSRDLPPGQIPLGVPAYFVYDAILNRKEHGLFDEAAAPRPLSAAEFMDRRAAGAVVLDARSPQDFAPGHLRGSVNVPADGRFAEQAGMVVAPEQDAVVIAPQDREEEVVTRLARIGFDKVGGYLREPEGAFPALADEMEQAGRLTADELCHLLDGDEPPLVLDVRNTAEREEGFIEGSLHIPLAELARRIDEIPADRPLVVHCAGGHRSSIAASLLRHQGRTDVSNLLGGYGAWLALPAPADV